LTKGPFRAQLRDVTRRRSVVIGLSLVIAVTPALAAESGGPADGTLESQEFESPGLPEVIVESPSLAKAPLREAVHGLALLRLHPGRDLLDVTETARTRPEAKAD
jgi:hypothetical protein